MEPLKDITEAAEIIGTSTKYIRVRVSEKWQGVHIPHFRIAGKLKFSVEDLKNYIDFHKHSAGSK